MNNRILLVFDDYQECENWHQLLQKLGFQIESVRTEAGVLSQLLSLRPEAVFIYGRGYQINPLNVLAKLSNQTWYTGKIILFESQAYPMYVADLGQFKFDGLLPSAVFDDIEKLEIIAQTLSLPFQALFDKYQAIFGNHRIEKVSSNEEVAFKKPMTEELQLEHYRMKRTQGCQIDGHKVNTSLTKEVGGKVNSPAYLADEPQSNDLIAQKREFVRALFVKD